jgi:hypothetical protein
MAPKPPGGSARPGDAVTLLDPSALEIETSHQIGRRMMWPLDPLLRRTP